MSQFDITKALAAEQHRDRIRAASQSRLATLARCCRPTAWGRTVRGVATAALAASSRRRTAGIACCA
jgi:hypothetical protein